MVFRLMSDIRTKLLLGTSISAVTMMLVMAAGFATNTNEISTSELILPLNGHVTVMAINPDGIISYAQGDNFIFGSGKDLAASALYDPNAGSRAAAFVCVGLGEEAFATVTESDKALTSALGTTNVVCSTAVPTANVSGVDGAGVGNKVDIIVATTIAVGEGTTTITEVALSNAGGGGLASAAAFTNGAISHIKLAAGIDVVEGTEITVTYTMETG